MFAALARIEINLAERKLPIDAETCGVRFQVICQLSICRFSYRGDIIRYERQLLLQPAPDNRVVPIQTHCYCFPGIDFLTHAVPDQAFELFTSRWTLPRTREADHHRRDLSLCDDNFAGLIVSARREEMIRDENGRPQKKEVNEWFANKFFHKRKLLFSGCVPDGRGIGALGRGHGNFWRHFHVEVFRVIGGPARRRNLDHSDVVECAQCRIEIRVFPDFD